MKKLKRYYSEDYRETFLELHDNRTLWKIKNQDFSDDEYFFLVEQAVDLFESATGTALILTGRSGRHVCIEDNKRNQLNYWRYREKALELERRLIASANAGKECITMF